MIDSFRFRPQGAADLTTSNTCNSVNSVTNPNQRMYFSHVCHQESVRGNNINTKFEHQDAGPVASESNPPRSQSPTRTRSTTASELPTQHDMLSSTTPTATVNSDSGHIDPSALGVNRPNNACLESKSTAVANGKATQNVNPAVSSDASTNSSTFITPYPDDSFHGAVQILGISPPIFVYPLSQSVIPDVYRERYIEVKNMFSKNVETHLSESAQHIDYVLKMCGPSEEDFHPSILVFCRTVDFKRLRAILRSKQLAPQYLLRKSTPRFALKGWMRNMQSPPVFANKPLFNIYFWSAQRPRNLLGTGYTEVSVQRTRKSTFVIDDDWSAYPPISGSCLYTTRRGQQLCTIGCALQIGTQLYGLTVAHSLIRETGENTADSSSVRSEAVQDWLLPVSSTEVEGDDSDMSDFISDVSYDDLASDLASDQTPETQEGEGNEDMIQATADLYDDALIDQSKLNFPEEQDSLLKNQLSKQSDLASTSLSSPQNQQTKMPTVSPIYYERNWQTTCAIVPHYNRHCEPYEGDFDWALVKLYEDYICPDLGTHTDTFWRYPRLFFQNVQLENHHENVGVMVITSQYREKRGWLQPVPAFIGGINIRKQTRMWSLKMLPLNGNNPDHFRIQA